MKECVNCGTAVGEATWYALDQQVATVTGAPVSATVREGLNELFQSRIDDKNNTEAGLCERCFNLLSVAISMKRTSADALEKFISTSSNVHVRNLNAPLLYDHLNTEINTKLVLQEGVDWYSVIADIPKNNVICYGSTVSYFPFIISTVAIEYINSIQDQINKLFSFCSDKAATSTESEMKETTSLSLDMSGSSLSKKNIHGTSLDNASVTSTKSSVDSSIQNSEGNQSQGQPDEETDEHVEKCHESEKEDEMNRCDDTEIKTGLNDSAVEKNADSTRMIDTPGNLHVNHVTLDQNFKDKPVQDQDGFDMDVECYLEIHVDYNDQENFLKDVDGKPDLRKKMMNILPDQLSDVSSEELDYEDSPQYEAEPVSTEESDVDILPSYEKKSAKGHKQPAEKSSKTGASQKKENNPKKTIVSGSQDKNWIRIKPRTSDLHSTEDSWLSNPTDSVEKCFAQDLETVEAENFTKQSNDREGSTIGDSERDVTTVINTDQLESDVTAEGKTDQLESDITGVRNIDQSESNVTVERNTDQLEIDVMAERKTDQLESDVTGERDTDQSKSYVTGERNTDQSEIEEMAERKTDQSESDVIAERKTDQDGGRKGSLEKRSSTEISTDQYERTKSDDLSNTVEENVQNQVDTLPSIPKSGLCRDSTETDIVDIEVSSKNEMADSVDIETLQQQMVKSKSDPGIDIEKISRRKNVNSDSELIMSPEKEQENLKKSKSAVESYMKIINKMKEKQNGENSQKSIPEKSGETCKSDKMNVFESPVLDEYIANNAFELSNVFGSTTEGRTKSVNNSEKLARIGRIMENVRTRNYCKSKGERESTPKSQSFKTIPDDYLNITSSNEKSKKKKSKNKEKSSKKNDAKTSKKKTSDDINVKNTDATKKGDEEINSRKGKIKSPTGVKKCLFADLGKQLGPDDIYAASTSVTSTELATDSVAITNVETSNGNNIPSENTKNISAATNLLPEAEVKSEEESEYFKSVQEDIDISSYISKTKKKKKSKKTPKVQNRKSLWNMKVSIKKKDKSAKDKIQSADSTKTINGIVDVSSTDFGFEEEKPVLSPQNVDRQNELQESQNIDPPNLDKEQEVELDMNELSVLTTDILQHLQPVVYLKRLSENLLNEYYSRSSSNSVDTEDQIDDNSDSERGSSIGLERSDKKYENGKVFQPLSASESDDLSVNDLKKLKKSKTSTKDKMVKGKLSLSKMAKDPEVPETGSHYRANMMKKGDKVAKTCDREKPPFRNGKDKACSKKTEKSTKIHKFYDESNFNDINPAKSIGTKTLSDESIQSNSATVSTDGKEVPTQRYDFSKLIKQKKLEKTTSGNDILQTAQSVTQMECTNYLSNENHFNNDDDATDTEFPDENEETEIITNSSNKTFADATGYQMGTNGEPITAEDTTRQVGSIIVMNTSEDAIYSSDKDAASEGLLMDEKEKDSDTVKCISETMESDLFVHHDKKSSNVGTWSLATEGLKSVEGKHGNANNESLQYVEGNTQRFPLSGLGEDINTKTSIVEKDVHKSLDEYENDKDIVGHSESGVGENICSNTTVNNDKINLKDIDSQPTTSSTQHVNVQQPQSEKEFIENLGKVTELTGIQSETSFQIEGCEEHENGEIEIIKENSCGKALVDNSIVAFKKLTSLEHLDEQVVSATEVEANGLKPVNEIEPYENRNSFTEYERSVQIEGSLKTSFTENESSIRIEDSQENEVNIEMQSTGQNVTINESETRLAVADNHRNYECSDVNTESDINTEELDHTQNESGDNISAAEDGIIVKICNKRPEIADNDLSDDTDVSQTCKNDENSDSNTVISMTENVQTTEPNLERFSEDINSTNNDPPFTKKSCTDKTSDFSSGISATENEDHIEIPEKTAVESIKTTDTSSEIVEMDSKDTDIFTCAVCGKKFGDEFAYHFHSMNKHQTSEEKEITSNTGTRNKSVTMDTNMTTIDTGKANHGKKGYAKKHAHSKKTETKITLEEMKNFKKEKLSNLQITADGHDKKREKRKNNNQREIIGNDRQREIKSNVNWRRKIFERTGTCGRRRQIEDLETNENSESDENGNLEKREFAMPKNLEF
ncbi:unnamed protein product [Mytilus coruscus]|uniref:C2H2-type domain-containing protein n=1 Tax=Mytilus coruscus TaxID=42192 RepID=A0A6J8ER00_MYTCO|nr:unnamed protein product [Mytilus coruscus]